MKLTVKEAIKITKGLNQITIYDRIRQDAANGFFSLATNRLTEDDIRDLKILGFFVIEKGQGWYVVDWAETVEERRNGINS